MPTHEQLVNLKVSLDNERAHRANAERERDHLRARVVELVAIATPAVALIERVDVYGVAYDHDQVVQNLRAATHPPAK